MGNKMIGSRLAHLLVPGPLSILERVPGRPLRSVCVATRRTGTPGCREVSKGTHTSTA